MRLRPSQVRRPAERSAILRRSPPIEPFERRRHFAAAQNLSPTCPSCGGAHGMCVSNDPAFQAAAAAQFGGAGSTGPESQPALGLRWTSTAIDGGTGSAGSPINLTWGFVADGFVIPRAGTIAAEQTAPSTLQARLNTLYGSQAVWQGLFQSVFDGWSAVSGVNYVFEPSDDSAAWGSAGVEGVRPDIRIGGHPIDGGFGQNILAYNYYPSNGDMVIDTDNFDAGSFFTNVSNNSRGLRNTIAHEHGHGLGLNHVDPISQSKLMEAFISSTFDGPQFDDVLGAQTLYGDPFEKNGRNNSAVTATDIGTLAVGSEQTLLGGKPVSINATAESDYYRFTLSDTRTLSFTLGPGGTPYLQGAQNGTVSSFDPRGQADLAISLYGTNGSTILQTASSVGLGGTEKIAPTTLAAGTYFLRVFRTSGSSTQMYRLGTSVDLPAAPSTPDLASASDTGQSTADNITADSTPTFSGVADPNVTVSLRLNGIEVATALADAAGLWSATAPAQADGGYDATALAINAFGQSVSSAALNIVIDTVAPAAPTNVRLAGADDTGISATDGLTKVATPRLTGNAQSGMTIEVHDGPLPLANSSADTNGGFNTAALPTLTDGGHTLEVVAIDVAGNASASAVVTFIIDTSAPAMGSAVFQRISRQAVTVDFSEPVYGAAPSLQLTNLTTPNAFATTPLILDSDTIEYTVPGNALTDGRYEGDFTAAGALTDATGNPLAAPAAPATVFNFLRADFDENSNVNFVDLLILARNYGASPRLHNTGDANYDGIVNFNDLLVVASSYQSTLPPLAAPALAPAAASTSTAARKEESRPADEVL